MNISAVILMHLSSTLLLFAIRNQLQINNIRSYENQVSSCSHNTLLPHGLICQNNAQYFCLLFVFKIRLAQF